MNTLLLLMFLALCPQIYPEKGAYIGIKTEDGKVLYIRYNIIMNYHEIELDNLSFIAKKNELGLWVIKSVETGLTRIANPLLAKGKAECKIRKLELHNYGIMVKHSNYYENYVVSSTPADQSKYKKDTYLVAFPISNLSYGILPLKKNTWKIIPIVEGETIDEQGIEWIGNPFMDLDWLKRFSD